MKDEAFRKQALAELKEEIAKGVADINAGRVRNFDAEGIIEQGRRLFATRHSTPDSVTDLAREASQRISSPIPSNCKILLGPPHWH